MHPWIPEVRGFKTSVFRTYLESWLQSASFHVIHHCNGQMSLVTQPLDNDILLFLKAEEVLYDHELILFFLFILSAPCMLSITFLLFLIHSMGSVKLLLILLHISLPSFVSSHSHFPHCQKTRSSFPISLYHCPHLTPGLLCNLIFTWLFLWIFKIDKNFPFILDLAHLPWERPRRREAGGINFQTATPEVVISGEFEVGGEGNFCQCACHVFLQVGFFLHLFCLTVFIILSPRRAKDGRRHHIRALAQ